MKSSAGEAGKHLQLPAPPAHRVLSFKPPPGEEATAVAWEEGSRWGAWDGEMEWEEP